MGSLQAQTSALQESETKEWLDRYLGSWGGEVSVETATGDVIRTFSVAAEYWKSDGELRALTAFEINDKMSFVEARNYFRNKLLFAEVTQGEATVVYRGYLRDQELYWIPYDAELNTERRMKEWFVKEEGVDVLYIEGVELLRSSKGVASVTLRARMIRR